MSDTAHVKREPKRIDQRLLDRIEKHRRLIVLTAICMLKNGTYVADLERGLKIMPRSAIIGTLKVLEQKGLVTSRLEKSRTAEGVEMRRYYGADDVELSFDV